MTAVPDSVLDFFPFPTIRQNQDVVIRAIHEAYEEGYKCVLLESPVGSGKSAMAATLARFYGDSHILTPRKNLQDQYFDDFKEFVSLLKGRSSYPCMYFDTLNERAKVIKVIEKGNSPLMAPGSRSCASGPCKDDREIYSECTGVIPCPYNVALGVALEEDHVVHNLHSFIFQTHFAGRFPPRELMVIDECHMVEDIIRDFLVVATTMRLTDRPEHVIPSMSSTKRTWLDWLDQDCFKLSNRDDEDKRQKTLDRINELVEGEYVVNVQGDERTHRTKISFIPKKIGTAPKRYLFDYGEKLLLMSGTIYDKNFYCRQTGLKPEEVKFIRVGSSFPVKNRPIYIKNEYMTDNSFKGWDINFPDLINNIVKIMEVFHDKKGLIHAPSYYAAEQLAEALAHTNRIMTHDREDFRESLDMFYHTAGNGVFVSPICQQGTDFKGDRATFQMVLRVPNPNASDPLVSSMLDDGNWKWYNYQALVTFGQILGRVNRSEEDFGVTVLMDSRFVNFIMKNGLLLPKWVKEAMVR